jgi:hypothetical protein
MKMATSEPMAAKLTYFPDEESDDTKYSDADDIVRVMRDGDSEVIEFKIEPGLNKSKSARDALYVRIPAQILMAALTKVMLDLSERD